jgi:hypothetical protein
MNKIKNFISNITFKKILKKFLEYFLIFVIFKISLFTFDRTIGKIYRQNNEIFKSSDFSTAKEAEDFLLKKFPIGSDVNELIGYLARHYGETGWCSQKFVKINEKEESVTCSEIFRASDSLLLKCIGMYTYIYPDKNNKIQKVRILRKKKCFKN